MFENLYSVGSIIKFRVEVNVEQLVMFIARMAHKHLHKLTRRIWAHLRVYRPNPLQTPWRSAVPSV